jgi:hypothetical protein
MLDCDQERHGGRYRTTPARGAVQCRGADLGGSYAPTPASRNTTRTLAAAGRDAIHASKQKQAGLSPRWRPTREAGLAAA